MVVVVVVVVTLAALEETAADIVRGVGEAVC